MKKTRLFMPLAVGLTAITPMAVLTACNKDSKPNITCDTKSINCGDSVAYYKFKINNKPDENKVVVTITNKNTIQEPVLLYTGVSYVDKTAIYTTDNDGNVNIPVGYYLAPSITASSEFSLSFAYSSGGKTYDDIVTGLKFNYNVDYGTDIKESYTVKHTDVPSADHWHPTTNKTVGEIYVEDILQNPDIFQDDARYSTSQRIKAAREAGTAFGTDGLNNFQAYFNDIVQEDDGLHVHMNYKLDGKKFEFTMSNSTTYTFTDFNISFTFETPNGYKFVEVTTNETGKKFNIIDPENEYHLDGRFKGTFTYQIGGGTQKTINYDGLIDNYTIFPGNGNEFDTPAEISSMFSFGIIQLTYGFIWGESTNLSILSNYAKNA